MKKKTKILAILAVAVMMFTVMAISCFAYDVGTTITFKDTYTQEELEKYFTEYKDVEGVYYSGDNVTNSVIPNLLSLEESITELVMLYRGSNFSVAYADSTWIAIAKESTDYRLYFHLSDSANEIYNYKVSTGAWGSAGKPESYTCDGTFTLTEEQFSSTGLLWTAVSPSKTSGTVIDMLSAIGGGLKDFLPDVAEAGVDTVETLFVTSEGKLTTFSTISIIVIVCSCGKGIYSVVKRKMRRI